MPDPAFQEDPELMAAIGGGAAKFQEDDQLLQALQRPQPANMQQANGPDMPTAQNGRVIDMPPQQIQGDPHTSLIDSILQHASQGYEALNNRFGPSPEQRAAQNDLAARQFVGGMEAGSTPAGAARRGAAYLSAPLAATGPVGMAVAAGTDQYAADPEHPGRAAGAAVASGLAGAGGQMIARGLGGMSQSSGNVADEFRNRAAGMPESEAVGMPQEALAARAKQIEDAGLVTRPFQSPAVYARNAQGLAAQGEATMRPAEDAINALPQSPSVPVGDIIAKQRAAAAAGRTLADPANAGPAGFREQFANNLQGDTLRVATPPMSDAQRFEALSKGYQPTAYHADQLPWNRALEQRRNVDGWTSFGPTNAEESAQNAIRKEIGGGLRDNIDQALNSPNVPPELAGNWRTGRDQYALGSQVNEQALKALGQGGKVPTSAPEALGFVARRGGLSAVADTARAAQSGLSGMAGAAEAAPSVGALQGWMQSKGVNHNDGSSQGGTSGNRAMQALQVNPQLLGKYADQFQEAERTGGSEAVNALINKLTFSDPEFRTSVYPMLSGQHAQ